MDLDFVRRDSWALQRHFEMYADAFVLQGAVQLTRISCQFDGMALQEYSVDPVHGDVLKKAEVLANLQAPPGDISIPHKLPVQVLSDFHEMQERQIRVDVVNDLKAADIFETNFDTTAMLLTLRGHFSWLPNYM
jgi:hypothetical protein